MGCERENDGGQGPGEKKHTRGEEGGARKADGGWQESNWTRARKFSRTQLGCIHAPLRFLGRVLNTMSRVRRPA